MLLLRGSIISLSNCEMYIVCEKWVNCIGIFIY